MCPREISVPWLWSAGLSPTSEDGGTLQSQVPGLCVAVMLVTAAARWAAIACCLFSTWERPPWYINDIAQVNARRKRFQAGKTGSLFIQAVMVLNRLQLF